VQTAYLIAEVIAIPLSGFLSRALGTRMLFATSAAGFTLASFMCATCLLDRADDPVARGAGLYRRRHDADGVRLGLYDLSAPAAISSPRSSAWSRRWRRPSARPSAAISPTLCPGTGCSSSTSCPASASPSACCLIDFDQPDFALLDRFDWFGLIRWRAFSARSNMCWRKARAMNGSRTSDTICAAVIVSGISAILPSLPAC
jgi:MFS transporter, DHA2 family, multidrug resistance protein